jgi:hypothetical protein
MQLAEYVHNIDNDSSFGLAKGHGREPFEIECTEQIPYHSRDLTPSSDSTFSLY